MRAREFITERTDSQRAVERRSRRPAGDLRDEYDYASTGALTSSDADRYYDLYRAGMLMGRAPADVHKVDAASWMNNRGYFGYYTDVERDKIETAFKELGLRPETLIEPGSQEPPGVNSKSPVQSFQGYPR